MEELLENNIIYLSVLDKDLFDKSIFKLIYKCYNDDNVDDAIKIINFCENARINIDPLPTITGFFLNPFFNVELLKWVTSLFPKEPTGYYLDIINSRNDDDALKIAKLLLIIFPNVNEEDWVQLAELTENFEDEEFENIQLREFLLSQSNNYAIFPDWVKEEESLLVEKSYPLLPKVEEAVDMILDDFRKFNIGFTEIDDDIIDNKNTAETVRENLITQYSISTSTEKIMMLSNIIEIPPFDDSPIFKEYGPVNCSYSCSLVIDENHECLKYGGCRMLLCNEYPKVDIFGEQIDLTAKNIITLDWFTHKCNQCNKKIRRKNHALRLPLYYGGWQGCYCSFQCLEKNVNDVIIALSVGRIKTQLYNIGINDK
jgi:hypothetical protein